MKLKQLINDKFNGDRSQVAFIMRKTIKLILESYSSYIILKTQSN